MNSVRKKIAKFGGQEAFGLVLIKDFAYSAVSQWQIGVKLSIEAVSEFCSINQDPDVIWIWANPFQKAK